MEREREQGKLFGKGEGGEAVREIFEEGEGGGREAVEERVSGLSGERGGREIAERDFFSVEGGSGSEFGQGLDERDTGEARRIIFVHKTPRIKNKK